MANVLTASKEKVDWAIEVLEGAGDGQTIDARDFFGATAVLSVVTDAAFSLSEEVEQLRAEVERLKLYTNPRLFAAASNVLDVMEQGGALEEAMNQLSEAVTWWDSLPFDPEKDTEKLPKYEE